MTYFESIFKVLIVGLVLGAGLPAVFAAGLVAYSNGAGGQHADGTTVAPNPVVKFAGIALFVFDLRPYLTNWFYRLGCHALNLAFAYFAVVYAWAAWKGGTP